MDARGAAVARLRVLAGPDKGREFDLPAGVSPGEAKINGTIRSGLDRTDGTPFHPSQLARTGTR